MATLTVHCDVLVPQTPTAVWSYVAEQYFEHHASWDPAIVGMDRETPGPLRTGTRGVETRRAGTKQRAEFEITDFRPTERFALRNLTGPFRLDRTYTFTPEGAATRLRFDFRMQPEGVMTVLFPLVRRVIAGQVHANIARIPQLVPTG